MDGANKSRITSNGDLRRQQSNHKTDESMKTGQSVGLFGQLFFRDARIVKLM